MSGDVAKDHRAASRLLDGFSIEMTGKDVLALERAAPLLPAGTQVSVTFLGHEDLAMRVGAARAARRLGFVPVPHVCARRLSSRRDLETFLGALAGEASAKSAVIVGGDPATPLGPFADSLSVIRTGLLGQYGFEHVSIGGYPEGHPTISNDDLWRAMRDKLLALAALGLDASIVTQLGFSSEPVLSWLTELRDRDIDVPVRIGVPGPAGLKRLLSYAQRLGVSSSAVIARKYHTSLASLLGNSGPDQFLQEIGERYDAAAHGRVLLHFYALGDIKATAQWVQHFARSGE